MTLKTITLSLITVLLLSGNALAVGYKTTITTKNDTFTNSGTIKGKQKVSSGVAYMVVGQRARSIQPDIGTVTYESKNNTYVNKGKIIGEQTVSGGKAYLAVAQEIY